MNFVYLVELIVAREERVQRQNLEEDATDTPDVHLVSVVSVSHQALRRTVPARRYVLRQWRLAVQPTTAAQVCKLDGVTRQQDVLANKVTLGATLTV